MGNTEFTFKIVKNIGVIAEHSYERSMELNLVSWQEKPAKFDIREWSKNHQRMSRGITFTEEELETLYRILGDYFRK